ncbi:hypothetical protein F5050DRAFT_1802703 [Lentinula boryana]|uniref:Rad26 atrip n=1 Tax=Lentinula boryana TaxID=40481 RepID=A0ABQ8QUV1_9AGAR|nr:hypothetical protein F5050DRAFT_1802703 [Lentinula boryana]
MDEYDFDDDFDDQTLAALAQIEKTLLVKNHVSPTPNPPAKRQKTETGWRSATTVANNSFDLDELPEISLCQNTYTFQQADGSNSPSLTPQAQLPKETDRRSANNTPVASTSRNIPKNNSVQSNRHSVPQKISSAVSRLTAPSRPPTHQNQPVLRSASTRTRNSARLLEHITNALANSSPEPPQPSMPQRHPLTPLAAARPSASASHVPIVSHPPAININEEIAAFQKQLEETRLENEKIRVALKDAEEAHIAKVGEVAVLRRGIQKTAEDHAAQIAKLKTAKEEADTRQTNMQRDLKEEIEQLKTQFIFKQHELESNSRRPPMSVHARRSIREVSSFAQTPVLGSRVTALPIARIIQESTPVKAPSSILHPPQSRSPEKTRQSAMLPGFENSFLESTPKRQHNKGKTRISPEIHRPLFADELRARDVSARAPGAVPDDGFGMDIDMPSPSSQKYVLKDPLTSSPTSSPIRQNDDSTEDVVLDEDVDEDDVDEIHFNWKAELTRIVLTHTQPSQSRSTFQILAEQSTAVSAPEDYSVQMSTILEVIASTTVKDDYQRAISVVTRCLVSIAFALNRSNLILPLVPLLNLLSTLIYSLPTLNSMALQQSAEDNNNNTSSVLILLCDIIRQFDVEKRSDSTLPVAAEALSLAESLCWRTPEDRVDRHIFSQSGYSHYSFGPRAALLALSPRNPSADSHVPLYGCLQSSKHSYTKHYSQDPHLARSFLSLPVSEPEENNHPVIIPKIPQLDRLCSFLIDTSRIDEESVALKENVATLLVVLSQTHPDALAALTSSNTIIPSLALYLTHLSSTIWEEDNSSTSKPSSLSSTIKSLNQTIYLLHYLVFNVEPEVGLKSKLQHASPRPFNGITHMFIVTFGRLSYAPIPEWIGSDRVYELSVIRDMARDLLELVVDGPECDNIYAAYHEEEEDEGDMEEELLGDT